jgi:hypothetical protein
MKASMSIFPSYDLKLFFKYTIIVINVLYMESSNYLRNNIESTKRIELMEVP